MRVNGARGRFLLTWAIGYIAIGLSYIITPTPGRAAAFSWLPIWDTPAQWGWIWLAAGIVAIVTAFRQSAREVNPTDRWGFTALFVPPIIWTVIYGVAVFTAHSINPLATLSIFAPMAIGMLVASEMENQVDPPRRGVLRHDE